MMAKWNRLAIVVFLGMGLFLTVTGESTAKLSVYIEGPGPMSISNTTVTAFNEGPGPITVTKA